MPRKQRLTWTVVLRLAVVVTGFASLVVLGGGTALSLVEGDGRTALCIPGATRSGGPHDPDDHRLWRPVPVTTTGRLIAAGVMVSGVAVIGAVAAIVALAVTLRVVREEELAFEAAAERPDAGLDLHLAAIAAQLPAGCTVARGIAGSHRRRPGANGTMSSGADGWRRCEVSFNSRTEASPPV